MIGSINIPFSSVTYGDPNVDNLGVHANLFKENIDKNVIVIGTEETDLEMV